MEAKVRVTAVTGVTATPTPSPMKKEGEGGIVGALAKPRGVARSRHRRHRRHGSIKSSQASRTLTAGSTSFGSVRRRLQPVVFAATQYSSPSYVAPLRWRGPSRGYRRGSRRARRAPLGGQFGASPSVRGECNDQNNCAPFSRVLSFCFRSIGASPCRSTSTSPAASVAAS
jgi:hypothetical protein